MSDAENTTREKIATILEPAAFEDHSIVESLKHTGHVAAIQWAARRNMAYEGADRLIAAGVFAVAAQAADAKLVDDLRDLARSYDGSAMTRQRGLGAHGLTSRLLARAADALTARHDH